MAVRVLFALVVFTTLHQTQQESIGCILGDVSTPCDSSATRYYHDPIDCLCKPLPPGQCQDNSFVSKEECINSCGMTRCPVCNLPKKHGNCTEYTKKYYYDIRTCRCETFNYGGCNGNDNRFETFDQCNHVCASFACPVCNLPYDKGSCKGMLEKWYFDDVSCTCKSFDYQGCDGNNNRFHTKLDCQRACLNTPCKQASCEQPMKEGPCKKLVQRYYYNTDTNNCESFRYGGCEPNSNNFVSKKYCKRKCMKAQSISPPDFDLFG